MRWFPRHLKDGMTQAVGETASDSSRVSSSRRALAVLVSLVCCCPAFGHCVLGRWQRGLAWYAVLVGIIIALPALPRLAVCLLPLWVVAGAVDVARLRSDGRPMPGAPAVLGAAAALFVGMTLIATLLRMTVMEAFKIPSGGMIPTLMIGDHLWVDKSHYGPRAPFTRSRMWSGATPRHGDVIVFEFPENRAQDFIKRVVAVGGEKVETVNRRPVVDGKLVPHCRVGKLALGPTSSDLFLEVAGGVAYLTAFDVDPDARTCTTDEQCLAEEGCRGGICGVVQGPWVVPRDEVWVMGDNRDNSHDSPSWNGGLGAGVPLDHIKGRAATIWMSFDPAGGMVADRMGIAVMGTPRLVGQNAALSAQLEACLRDGAVTTSR
jgi:signal peptidase I